MGFDLAQEGLEKVLGIEFLKVVNSLSYSNITQGHPEFFCDGQHHSASGRSVHFGQN